MCRPAFSPSMNRNVDARPVIQQAVPGTTNAILYLPANMSRAVAIFAAWNASDPIDYFLAVGPMKDGTIRPIAVLTRYDAHCHLSVEHYGQLVTGELWCQSITGASIQVQASEMVEVRE